jgi:hypothetical protein
MKSQIKQSARENLFLFILVLLAIVVHVFSWSSGHNWGDDFSAYIMQAISLTEGTTHEFIARNAFTINNSLYPPGPLSYPWGFPILLAPIFILFGLNIIAFKGMVLFFFFGFLVILWFLFKKELALVDRIIFVAFFAFNPMFLKFGDNVLSDTPFLFFSTFSFLIFSKLYKAKSRHTLYWLSFWLGLSFVASTAIRTNGILLPLTYFIMLLLLLSRSFFSSIRVFNIQWLFISETRLAHKFFIYLLPLIIFTSSSWLLGKLLPDYQSSHLSYFKDVTIRSIFVNVFYYGQLIKDFFGYQFPINLIIYLFSIPLLFFGLRKKWRNSTPILIYTTLTLVLYILWPHRQGLRFLFPVLPFYLYFVFIGFNTVIPKHYYFSVGGFREIKLTRIRLMIAVLLILILQSSWQLYQNVSRESDGVLTNGPYSNEAREMFDFVRQNVPQNEVVIFRRPRVMRLFTDRDSIVIDKTYDVKYLQKFIRVMSLFADRDKEVLGKTSDIMYQQWFMTVIRFFTEKDLTVFNRISDVRFRQWVVIDKQYISIDKLIEDLLLTYPTSMVFENSQFQIFKFD